MFLHLGRNVVVPLEEIVAIIDMASALTSKITREFVNAAQEEGFIKEINSSELKPKSIVITGKDIYFSPISSTTLCKRAGYIDDISAV